MTFSSSYSSGHLEMGLQAKWEALGVLWSVLGIGFLCSTLSSSVSTQSQVLTVFYPDLSLQIFFHLRNKEENEGDFQILHYDLEARSGDGRSRPGRPGNS